MFTALGEGVKNLVVNAIKIALLVALLIGIVKWMQANPVTAQAMFTSVANAAASTVTWASEQIVELTS